MKKKKGNKINQPFYRQLKRIINWGLTKFFLYNNNFNFIDIRHYLLINQSIKKIYGLFVNNVKPRSSNESNATSF